MTRRGRCYLGAVSADSADLYEIAESKLIALLGPTHADLVDELLRVGGMASANVRWERDWRGPEVRRVRRLARQLDETIGKMPRMTQRMLEHAFEEESRRFFGPQVEQAVPGIVSWYFDWFREQLRYLASPALVSKRAVGRQRERDRDRLAVDVARFFRGAGLKRTKYERGLFGRVLVVVLRYAGFDVPANPYRLIVHAVAATKAPDTPRPPTSRAANPKSAQRQAVRSRRDARADTDRPMRRTRGRVTPGRRNRRG